MTATRSTPKATARLEPSYEGFGPPPRPRSSRSAASILLGVMLVVFCAAGVAAFTASIGHRHPVLVVVRSVSAGSLITDGDLGEARLPPDSALHTIGASQRDRVVGRAAAVNLVPGTLLVPGELASGPRVDADHALVGLALKDGQFPDGLRPLDPVSVIETSPTSGAGSGEGPAAPTVLADDAQVASVHVAADGQATAVSLLVPRAVAPAIANAAASGQISLVQLGGTG